MMIELIVAMHLEVMDPELSCLALNAYHEARSDGAEGMVAVSHVVLNRVRSRRWPDDVCGVVWQRSQFSWTRDGRSDRPHEVDPWAQAIAAAASVLEGEAGDPTDGATHYHAEWVRPRWARSCDVTARIGGHIFYGECVS